MQTYIALFRGINIGGHNIIKMADLRGLLKDIGLRDVNSYIQSGNVIFRSEEVDPEQLAQDISAKIAKKYDFEPRVLISKKGEFLHIMESNPFPEAETDSRRLHVFFLTEMIESPDLEGIEEVKRESEQYELKENAFYLYAPEGIGRSKLVSQIDRLLGVPTTGRNWRTMRKIRQMAEEL